jgi:hypothetical protein
MNGAPVSSCILYEIAQKFFFPDFANLKGLRNRFHRFATTKKESVRATPPDALVSKA